MAYVAAARALFLRLERAVDDVANIGSARARTSMTHHTRTALIASDDSEPGTAARLAQLNATALRLETINKNIMDETRLFDALKARCRHNSPILNARRQLSCGTC